MTQSKKQVIVKNGIDHPELGRLEPGETVAFADLGKSGSWLLEQGHVAEPEPTEKEGK